MTSRHEGPAPVPPVLAWAAWPLPLLAGAVPLLAALLAFWLSLRLGAVDFCNPLIDGCISISRAARHGLPNYLFRALILPAAVLQALCWLLCRASLLTLGAAPTWRLHALPWIGLLAAFFLVLYGTFLGTEGVAYRWMRRYGVVMYFGGTCIAMLLASGVAQGLTARARHVERSMFVLSIALPMLGLVSAFAPLFLADEQGVAAMQNRAEWWGGLVFTLFFFAMAWFWRVTHFKVHFSVP